MMIRFERPVSRSAYLARRLGHMGFLLTLAALVTHRFGLIATPSFVALVMVSAVFAAAAVVFALVGLQRLWQVGAEGGLAAMRALLVSLLPLSLVGLAVEGARTTPDIADISTDRREPPAWIEPPRANQVFLPPPDRSPAAIARAETAYPDLTGRRYEGALDRVYRAVTKVAAQERIAILSESGIEKAVDLEDAPLPERPDTAAVGDAPAETPAIGPVPLERPDAALGPVPRGDVLLQGEKKTLVLGLPFDVVIRLREDAETTSVDIRVAARYGNRDFGMGAEIAESYLRALDAELLGIAGS
ncbi:DUF1499 domain-containing protein [Gellertiella hungarica]|uniref:DUF1499 domain-containing protein n=1 Tax=Gellertiella hungarica TaxID=1572859 RepID=A0A7W6J462_9HYPH|nr:DUF1499 domain-containing protein [Gellertiella hungarica]MBB4064484.1 hypothetical protein [Gellertiella hungarica]